MRMSLTRNRSLIAVTAAMALLLTLGAGTIGNRVAAQDAAAGSHPAHIHTGTCTELGDVVFPLSDVGPSMAMDGTPMAMGDMMGATGAIPVDISVTTVPAALADIVAGGHAINVHESAENIGNYIACGDIGGVMMGTADLAIGLGELNGSGHSGVATLHDNGDSTTNVAVFLTESAGDDMAEEETTDDAAVDTATGAAVAVDISGFAFNPGTIEVAVGDTVTWTNNDSAPHTVTQRPSGSGFQSETLQPGDSFSFTFDTAGTFDYFCEFHANMSGQVVVS